MDQGLFQFVLDDAGGGAGVTVFDGLDEGGVAFPARVRIVFAQGEDVHEVDQAIAQGDVGVDEGRVVPAGGGAVRELIRDAAGYMAELADARPGAVNQSR